MTNGNYDNPYISRTISHSCIHAIVLSCYRSYLEYSKKIIHSLIVIESKFFVSCE